MRVAIQLKQFGVAAMSMASGWRTVRVRLQECSEREEEEDCGWSTQEMRRAAMCARRECTSRGSLLCLSDCAGVAVFLKFPTEHAVQSGGADRKSKTMMSEEV